MLIVAEVEDPGSRIQDSLPVIGGRIDNVNVSR